MRPDRTRARRLALALALAPAALGCADDPGGRRPIRGEVTLDGRPLERGAVLFEPDDDAPDAPGTAVGATIEAGRFAIDRRDGPAPGAYKVRIHASSGAQADPAPSGSSRSRRPMIERIPDRYNTQTELRARVEPDGPNAFRFELRTDPAAPPGAPDP